MAALISRLHCAPAQPTGRATTSPRNCAPRSNSKSPPAKRSLKRPRTTWPEKPALRPSAQGGPDRWGVVVGCDGSDRDRALGMGSDKEQFIKSKSGASRCDLGHTPHCNRGGSVVDGVEVLTLATPRQPHRAQPLAPASSRSTDERMARRLRTLIDADERRLRPRPITLPKLPSFDRS